MRIGPLAQTSYSGYYWHDGAGRPIAHVEGFQRVALRYGYDWAGRRWSLGLRAQGVTSTTDYRYDPAGRLRTLAHDLAGPGGDQVFGFAYNPASQVIERSSTNDSYAWTRGITVDRPYEVNGQNQYLSVSGQRYEYDDNSNLIWDGGTHFRYDSENRLVSASGAKNATLSYDPLGRLWQVARPGGATRFHYDGDDLIQERDGDGALLRAYVHGPGADEPLIWYEYTAGWSRSFLHSDHQGSVVAVADSAGLPTAFNAYDEYGFPNLGNAGRFGYTGQSWIAELGLWYYKARFYSPLLGRFLQVDPIGYDDQFNLYVYVRNDPVNGTDPSGQCEICPRFSRWGGRVDSRRATSTTPKARQPSTVGNNTASPTVKGSTATSVVARSLDAMAEAGVETGAKAKDVLPIRALGKGVEGVGVYLAYEDYRSQGHSPGASAAGALAEEGTGLTFTATGAAIGTFIEPGGGTIAGAVIGFGIDKLSGVGDKVGQATANGYNYVASGAMNDDINKIAAEAIRRATRNDRDFYGR